jgi:hypothetical protein
MAVQKKASPTTNTKTSAKPTTNKPRFDFAFERINYIWMLVGVALLILGYILLVGGGAKTPDEFNYSLFDTRRLVIAPILMVLGIAVEIYAILLKPKNKGENTSNQE